MEKILVKIKRQDSPEGFPYWEEFYVPIEERMTVISVLKIIEDKALNSDGLKCAPVASEHSCMEELCGACTMIINGKVRQACAALVEDLEEPIVIEPLSKFPVLRDLKVDRSRMFESLKEIKNWKEIDGFQDSHEILRIDPEANEMQREMSVCIMCGCCAEACPQVNDRSGYLGAYIVLQAQFSNVKDSGKRFVEERMNFMKGPEGIAGCDNARNCDAVCPKGIDLNGAISGMQWSITKYSLINFLKG